MQDLRQSSAIVRSAYLIWVGIREAPEVLVGKCGPFVEVICNWGADRALSRRSGKRERRPAFSRLVRVSLVEVEVGSLIA